MPHARALFLVRRHVMFFALITYHLFGLTTFHVEFVEPGCNRNITRKIRLAISNPDVIGKVRVEIVSPKPGCNRNNTRGIRLAINVKHIHTPLILMFPFP
jgi:hypothetical protein